MMKGFSDVRYMVGPRVGMLENPYSLEQWRVWPEL